MDRAGKKTWGWDILWLLVLAIASSAWTVSAAARLSATFDEPIYLSRGVERWRTGSYGGLMKLGTMPLPVDVCTLPLYLYERWHGAQLDVMGQMEQVLPWARLGTLLFWWLLLVYGWSVARSLAGPWAGRIAVLILACEPNLLAHAGLATTDIALSACLLAFVYHYRRGRDGRWWRRVGVPAAWLAASILAKASGLLFGPLCMLVIELERLVRAGDYPSRTGAGIRNWLCRVWQVSRPFRRDLNGIIAVSLVLVFAYIGCDWQPLPSFIKWAHALPAEDVGRPYWVWVADHFCVFSNAGEGLMRQVSHNLRGHGVFLLGQFSRRAFWYYFPVALSIKLTVPLLIAPLLLLALRWRSLANWAFLAGAALLAFSLTYRVQTGIRFVLPGVVLLIVGLAAAVTEVVRHFGPGWGRRFVVGGLAVGIAWTIRAGVAVWPHGLCYVNELWGGTAQGYRLLSDSNFDWGQGLKDLADWHRENGKAPMHVWYFGTDPSVDQPPRHHLAIHCLDCQRPEQLVARVRGTYLAVSMSLLGADRTTQAGRVASEFLLTQHPVARTMTFFIYDFTHATKKPRPETAAR